MEEGRRHKVSEFKGVVSMNIAIKEARGSNAVVEDRCLVERS